MEAFELLSALSNRHWLNMSSAQCDPWRAGCACFCRSLFYLCLVSHLSPSTGEADPRPDAGRGELEEEEEECTLGALGFAALGTADESPLL